MYILYIIKMENCNQCTSIEYFYKPSKKCDNDKVNKMRENIIKQLLEKKDIEYCDKCKEKYLQLKNNFDNIFTDIYNRRFDNYEVISKGGRGCKCDYELIFYYKDNEKYVVNLEFKYGTTKITGCPQFLNQPAKNCDYHKFYYESFLTKLNEKYNFTSPSFNIYEKEIFKNSSNNEYFINLKEKDVKGSQFKKDKDKFVKDSIYKYLSNYKVDYNYWQDKFKEQNRKIFLLCKNGKFYVDKFSNKELTLKNEHYIKNKNTIVLKTNTSSEIHMLLRWKNRLGVLLPAWQVKLVRL